MSFTHQFKPAHKEIKRYYEELAGYATHEVAHEGATSSAFQNLLAATCKKADWHLVPQLSTRIRGKQVRPDGTLRDQFNLHHGYWEAKDSSDKIDVEIRKKIALGYPLSNTIFEDTATAVLFQNGREVEPRFDIRDPQQLCDLLNLFYSHVEPDIEGFEQAVEDFKERVPQLALALKDKIEEAHKKNKKFQESFETFFDLCRVSLNPNISEAAVDEMLIQHLLTIRLFDTIFDNPDFVRRNVIAAEVEKVIDALASKAFSREQFLKSLDRFYVAIESAARVLGEDFTEKQHFLNTVYERFFQGYSVKVADTHGIVYTPQEIVDFMCASVEEVLKTEFGKTLGSRDVNILDPCTGTGNFIVNLIRRVPKKDLKRVYAEQLFANEVMLLPYYIAALNIEHAFFEATREYEAFEGLCFVDTLELSEKKQQVLSFMTERNTERVARQKATPITVIIGNPPYNQSQQDENDRNKNRSYQVVEEKIAATYVRDSSATLRMQLYDPYIKFFRWATDRLPKGRGIVCLISNNGFLQGAAFNGFRKHLEQDFDAIYHFDFKGNARTTGEQRKREGGNIFRDQIRCGVGITLLVRGSNRKELLYHGVDDYWKAEKKRRYLESFDSVTTVPWTRLHPNERNDWIVLAYGDEFELFTPLGVKSKELINNSQSPPIFQVFTSGVKTNSDPYIYAFDRRQLAMRAEEMVDNFNSELDRWKRSGEPSDIEGFVRVNERVLKWIRNTKRALTRGKHLRFKKDGLRVGLYRPFTRMSYYFERAFNEDTYRWRSVLPTKEQESENQAICCTIEPQIEFSAIATCHIPCLHVGGRQGQCFPFYVYDEDGMNRRENITDWALQNFRSHYNDKKITKWDIFYYAYGILHHFGFRTKFADNLKRELPRIPLAPDFKAFAKAGQKLAELHLNFEQLEPWPLKWIETEGVPLSYHVEKMRLSKDKTQLKVNESLTLAKIPAEVFEYRLGNRSALDWVIDQYQISTDKRSGINSDPNNADDEEYIVRLVGQVVRVSVETVKIVNNLPKEFSSSPKRAKSPAGKG